MVDHLNYPQRCAHELFREQAIKAPDRPALLHQNGVVSYGALDRRSTALSNRLRERGVQPKDFVGLHLSSSVPAIVAVLGILKAGATAVPLDPMYPRKRLDLMIADCRPKSIVTTRAHEHDVPGALLCVEDVDQEDASIPHDLETATTDISLDSAAFVLYTSGSTGRPKGVVRPHRAIVSRLAWVSAAADDVFCHNMSLNVGFSQERLFLPLMLGLPSAVIPPNVCEDIFRFVEAIATSNVTNITLVPDVLRQILACCRHTGARLSRLRSVAVGSAPLTHDLAELFYETLPHAELVNAYGSTESGSVIRGVVRPNTDSPVVVIGRPVPSAQAHILNDHLKPVPAGATGDLYVCGPSVASGYLNLPEQTPRSFLPNPFDDATTKVLYKTGDLARQLPDGTIELVGRVDRQVKIRGSRIELGEVEAAIVEYKPVKETIVVAVEVRGQHQLVAYVVWQDGTVDDVSHLRSYLVEHLPAYMVPSRFAVLAKLPRGLNSKVDSSLLPPIDSLSQGARSDYVAPQTPTEIRTAQIWQNTLGLTPVGANDRFFEIGGDSVQAAQMLCSVWSDLEVEVPVKVLLERSSLREFSSAIDAMIAAGGTKRVHSIIPSRRIGPFAPSILQNERLTFESWAGANSIPYRQARIRTLFEIQGELDLALLQEAINEIVRRHDVLRTVFSKDETGGIRAEIRGDAPVIVPMLPLDQFHGDEQERRIQETVAEKAARHFDYQAAPLLRCVLMKVSGDRHRLLVVVSHLIADALSMNVFQRELVAMYDAFSKGLPSPLAPLRIQYADFADWQRSQLKPARLDEFIDRWEFHFQAFHEFNLLRLPMARRPAEDCSLRAESVSVDIDADCRRDLTHFAVERHATFYMILVTAFSVLLYLHTRINRVALMVHFANRNRPESQDLIGWLANSFMIGVSVAPESTIDHVLQQVRQILLEIEDNQAIPLPIAARALSEKLGRKGEQMPPPPKPPMPRVSFELLPSVPGGESDLKIRRISPAPDITEWGLRIAAGEHDGGATVRAIYSTAMFDKSGVSKLLSDFIGLLARIVTSSDVPFKRLPS